MLWDSLKAGRVCSSLPAGEGRAPLGGRRQWGLLPRPGSVFGLNAHRHGENRRSATGKSSPAGPSPRTHCKALPCVDTRPGVALLPVGFHSLGSPGRRSVLPEAGPFQVPRGERDRHACSHTAIETKRGIGMEHREPRARHVGKLRAQPEPGGTGHPGASAGSL